MRGGSAALVAGLVLGLMSGTAKASYIFDVDYFIGGGHVTGDIVTNTDSGSLAPKNIVGYSLSSNGVTANFLSYTGSALSISNNNLVWTFGVDSNLAASMNGIEVLRFGSYFAEAAVDAGDDDGQIYSPGQILTLGTFAGSSAVPLPASAPMFGAALLALGAVGYGIRRKKAAAA